MGFAIRRRTAAIALLSLFATDCHPRDAGAPTPAPALADADVNPAAVPGSPTTPPTAREIRAAMFAISAHVLNMDRPVPPEWQLMDLRDAARIVQRDAATSNAGKSRRRRAVARFAVAGLNLNDGTIKPEFREFLVAVDAPMREIEQMIQSRRAVAGALDFDRNQLLRDLYTLTPLSMAGCTPLGPAIVEVDVDPPTCTNHPVDWTTDATHKRVAFDIQGPTLDQLRMALDPQSWDGKDANGDRCFLYSDPAVNNAFWEPACALRDDLSDCLNCRRPPGGDWWPLREVFYADWSGFANSTSEFHVRLLVKTGLGPSSYHADFCLDKAGYIKVGNTSNLDPQNTGKAIDVDEGFSDVAKTTNPVVHTITAEKWLRFTPGWKNQDGEEIDDTLNDFADALLDGMIYGLEEQACCAVVDHSPACSPPPPSIPSASPVLLP